jgi:organic radical activating enzyme
VVSLLSGWGQGWPGLHHSLSLTGGEPLLKYELLLDWLPVLADMFPIYLETNGVLHSALAGLIDHIDHISMDIKLPSTSGQANLWDHHSDFLKVAVRKDLLVKTVIGDQTEAWEIIRACEIIAAVDRTIPLILQPVTLADGHLGISPFRMLELQELASAILTEVRVIPQTHKFIGQL